MELAKRMERLGMEPAFEVLVRARELERQGRDIVHLEIGEPDFDTPSNVVQAAVKALTSGSTHYTPSAGTPEFREAIAADQSRRKGLPVDAANVVVTPGGKPIMFYVMLALLEEGDEVVFPNPGFPIYESMIDFLGATPVPIGFLEEGNRFRWDVDEAVRRRRSDLHRDASRVAPLRGDPVGERVLPDRVARGDPRRTERHRREGTPRAGGGARA